MHPEDLKEAPSPKAAKVFRHLASLAHEHLPDALPPEQERFALARLEAALARREGWAARLQGWRFVFAGAAVAAGLAVVAAMNLRVTYRIEGGAEVADGTIEPRRASGSTVRFSDGTEVALDPDTRGRITSVGLRGARVALAEGRARVKVAKRPRARWAFDAGPFEVEVTGTAFDLRWSRAEQRFEIRLHSGSVRVRGPLATDGVDVTAGHRLVARLDRGELRLDSIAGPETAVATPVGVPLPAPAERPAPRLAPAPREVAPPPSWNKRIASGEHLRVLREAERRGISATLAQASSADLAALADAARYAGRNEIARKALLAQRRRFPHSPRARDAAFLLGRLAEDKRNNGNEALRWYDAYLAEGGDGSYSAEALGRKMVATQRRGGGAKACPIAREYLERYPGGPYARLAEGICAPPRP